MGDPTNRARSVRAIALAVLAAALLACGGSNGGHPDASNPDGSGLHGCVSTQQYFAIAVYGAVMQSHCSGCHNADGVARGTRMVLQPPLAGDAMQANYETVRRVAALTDEGGRPLLLMKPSAQVAHFGGNVLNYTAGQPNADYDALQEFVRQAQNPVSCPDDATDVTAGVPLLDWPATLRKASLSLVGRLPTDAETARVQSEGEAGFDAVLDAMLAEPAFGDRVVEYFNDQLFTESYAWVPELEYRVYSTPYPAVAMLEYTEQFDDLPLHWYEHLTADQQAQFAWLGASSADDLVESLRILVNDGIAHEPLRLIAHVVQEDRPFTEVLTADYLMVNPFSARSYGAQDVTFTDPTNANEWRESRQNVNLGVRTDRAGVLGSVVTLNRYPTTESNLNRTRSRMVYRAFLATDVMRLGQQPPNNSGENATRTNPACVACHGNLDPLAGTFQNYDERGFYYPPTADAPWPNTVFPPGLGNATLPADQTHAALGWLAQRIAADPRFAYAAVHHAYTMLLGRPPLSPPSDPSDPNAQAQLAAFLTQRRAVEQWAAALRANHFSFKTALRQVLKSVYYRAAGVPQGRAMDPALADVGLAHLRTPEELHREIVAVTGYDWRRDDYLVSSFLTDYYKFFYGGIDDYIITTRPATPSGLMGNLVLRMANDVACAVTSFDFTKPAAQRRLFGAVETDVMPEDAQGNAVAANVTRIRQQLAALHARVLGEPVAPDAPEVDESYQLFLETWRAGHAAVAAGTRTADLGWCSADRDLEAPDRSFPALPDARQIDTDPNYTIRAWRIVLTGMLSDYRFVYE